MKVAASWDILMITDVSGENLSSKIRLDVHGFRLQ